ncbi:MAG: hypothetical protein ACI8ZX_003077 [Planctomycetota bacterium]|jgi:hypothetical protein
MVVKTIKKIDGIHNDVVVEEIVNKFMTLD